jgi:hypothetical protein
MSGVSVLLWSKRATLCPATVEDVDEVAEAEEVVLEETVELENIAGPLEDLEKVETPVVVLGGNPDPIPE